MFRPPIYKLPTQAYNQTMYVWNMKIAKTELVKQSKLKLIITIAVIKRQRLRGREMQTQRQHSDVLAKRKPKSSVKNLSAALQAVNNPLENKVGIH